MTSSGGSGLTPRRRGAGASLALAAALLTVMVAACYGAVAGHDFVNLDDDLYVSANRVVRQGLTAAGTAWACTTFDLGNWHPLTWLSHMADVELFGLEPGWHHLVSALIHLANTLLVLLVLRGMTGELPASFFVAALFAVHPLHVESVAWVSERKDVLSAFFWLATMAAYLRYVRRPEGGRYLAVLLPFALGLTAKPMLVTLPLVLLLLDYWPLGRFAPAKQGGPGRSAAGLLREKAPLLALAAVSGAVTFAAQRQGGTVLPLETYSLAMRCANALVSYGRYALKTFLPSGLAAYYPLAAQDLESWQVILAGLLLVGVSALVFRRRASAPWAVSGWAWYLVTLLPVIGLVQVGNQSMADRYTYLPLIGLFTALVWTLGGLLPASRRYRVAGSLAGMAVMVPLMAVTVTQVGYWRDSVSLWERALAVTRGNWLAHVDLGTALYARGEYARADANFEEALRIDPGNAEAHYNLGISRLREERTREAQEHFEAALAARPGFAPAHFSLGAVLMGQGRRREALDEYAAALAAKPDFPRALNNMGYALLEEGDAAGALPYLRRAVELQGDYTRARFNLAEALGRLGRGEESAAHLDEAMRQIGEQSRDRQDAARNGGQASPVPGWGGLP